mmetsp:Transcript_18946/g.35343  ORF Transcript_18946/g.35343 Transcript_18946/m.35343 type:complete len:215 (+) Transcript_18946:1759-2403(+)
MQPKPKIQRFPCAIVVICQDGMQTSISCPITQYVALPFIEMKSPGRLNFVAILSPDGVNRNKEYRGTSSHSHCAYHLSKPFMEGKVQMGWQIPDAIVEIDLIGNEFVRAHRFGVQASGFGVDCFHKLLCGLKDIQWWCLGSSLLISRSIAVFLLVLLCQIQDTNGLAICLFVFLGLVTHLFCRIQPHTGLVHPLQCPRTHKPKGTQFGVTLVQS